MLKKVVAHLKNGANRNMAIRDSISEILESRFGMARPDFAVKFTKNQEYYKQRDEMDKIFKDIWDIPKERFDRPNSENKLSLKRNQIE
jgi:hypothetical protein